MPTPSEAGTAVRMILSALLGLLGGERDVVQAPNRPGPVSYHATTLQPFQLLALCQPLFSILSLSDDNDRVPYEHIGTVQPEDMHHFLCCNNMLVTTIHHEPAISIQNASPPRVNAALSFLFSNKNFPFYWLSASLPRQLLGRVQALWKSWLECYDLVHISIDNPGLGFIVLFFAQPNVQRLSSVSFDTSKSIYHILHLY